MKITRTQALLTLCCAFYLGHTSAAENAQPPAQPQLNDILRIEDLQRSKTAPPSKADNAIESAAKLASTEPRVIDPGVNGSPPSDAIILFNGQDLSQWKGVSGGEAKWKVQGGTAEVNGTGNIVSKEEFGDVQVHVEWASPSEVKGDGQGRGNSGVYLQGRYEIQVLDSYQNKTYFNGQAGALYGIAPPLVNACRKPGEWQSYDIIFHAPKPSSDGKVEAGSVTVLHNGVLVQDHVAVTGQSTTAAAFQSVVAKGPLMLQDHGNPVHYRNIWIRRL
jgi:hypothetical protein